MQRHKPDGALIRALRSRIVEKDGFALAAAAVPMGTPAIAPTARAGCSSPAAPRRPSDDPAAPSSDQSEPTIGESAAAIVPLWIRLEDAANDRLPPAPIIARRDRVAAIGALVDFGIIIVVAAATIGVFFGIALVLLQRVAEPGIAQRPVRATTGAIAGRPQGGFRRGGGAANHPAGTSPAEPVQLPRRAAGSAAPPPIPTVAGSAPNAPGLVARGDAFFRAGDLVSARLFYERAADGGDAQAALRAGATFDPAFLAGIGWRGMRSDPARAVFWYRRAAELGARNAEPYLNRLQPK